MKKKLIATLLASAMCMSMLAGCGSTNTDAPASSTPSGSAPASSSTPSATPEPTPEPKLDFGGQVITWLVRDDNHVDGMGRYQMLKAIEVLEEDLNVDIQFTVISGKGDDALTPLLTAGDLPDLMSWKWNDYYRDNGGIPGLVNDGIAREVTDLIDKMPNLQKIFEEYPNVAKDMKNAEGKYLYFQRINPLASVEDVMASTSTGLIIRKDWLDNVGLEVPTNMAEWYDVLSAFKTMDPNGNGENDELPFDGDSSGIMLFEAAYAMDGAQYIDVDTGKVDYGARTQKYKAYLEEMNKWYSEGLLCNVYDENGNGISKTTEETIPQDLAGSWKGLANAFGRNTFTELQAKKPDAAIEPCPWPATADGKVYSERTVSSTQAVTVLVTTDCDCLDAVAAVMDWCYSEKGSLLLTWGEENVTFTYDADGNRMLTEDGIAQVDLNNGKTVNLYKTYGDTSNMTPSFSNWDVNLATRDDWYKNASKVWADASFDIRYPGSITLSAEQSEKVSKSNNSELFAYIGEMKWKFITGQEPLSNFDTYVAQLETMGISDIVAVYQEAYDEYMSR